MGTELDELFFFVKPCHVWQAPGEHLEEEHAEGVYVGGGPLFGQVAVRLFRRSIRRRTGGTLAFGCAGVVHASPRNAPIHDEDLTEFADHDVFGLQVAVNDADAMGMSDGIADAGKNVEQSSA